MHSNTTATTLARIEAIRGFWKPGMSSKKIAETLSEIEGTTVSKNAVIGIYKRNKDYLLECPLPPSGRDMVSQKRVKAAKPAKPRAKKPAIVPPKPVQGHSNVVPFVLPETAFTYVATHPTKRLMDLKANECRWPMNGSGADTQFCSQEADGTYCEHHRAMSIGKGSRGEQEALKTLRKLA